jgi:hypothetical protein
MRYDSKPRTCSVGIATSYGLNGPASIPDRTRFFSSPQRPDKLWGPSTSYSMGMGALSPGVKGAGA